MPHSTPPPMSETVRRPQITIIIILHSIRIKSDWTEIVTYALLKLYHDHNLDTGMRHDLNVWRGRSRQMTKQKWINNHGITGSDKQMNIINSLTRGASQATKIHMEIVHYLLAVSTQRGVTGVVLFELSWLLTRFFSLSRCTKALK